MATIVNARDILLQGASERLTDVDLPSNINVPVDNIPALTGVSLTASSQLFQIPAVGDPYPSAIVLRAVVRNLTGTPTLSLVDGTMGVVPAFDINLTFTFSVEDMTSDAVTFKATVMEPDPLGGPDVEYSDTFTVLKTRESEASIIGLLTNENFTLTADAAGNVVTYTGAEGHFVVIQGLTDITEDCTFSIVDNPQNLDIVLDPSGVGAGSYSIVSGFAAADLVATVTFRATYGAFTIDKVLSLSKALRGNNGSTGPVGDKTATVYLYAWSSSQPANPNGSSTYTWATGEHASFTGPTWSTTVGNNPGIPSVKLWVASQQVVASGTATSSTVTWNASGTGYQVYAAGQNGTNGSNGADGLKSASPTVYRWDTSTPAGPSGSDTYNWSTGSFSGPSGTGTTWFLTPPTSPSPGFTLWAAIKTISDGVSVSSSGFNWTGASIQPRGYAGTNGSTGGTGAQGASARYAYSRIAGNPTPVGGFVNHVGDGVPTSAESNSAWGLSVSWSTSDPNPASTDTLYQSDGIYNPVSGLTVWSTPYISSLKVGSLSAVAVNTGTLNVDGTISVGSGGSITGPGFSLTSSAATFGGTLSAPSGTLGQLSISGTGYINGNGAGFETGAGFYLNAQSFSIGQSGRYLSYSTSSGLLKTGAIQMEGLMTTPGKSNVDSGNGIMIGRWPTDGNSYFGVTGGGKGIWVSTADGVVHMTGADVSGGAITGSLIQTATSGQRIVLNESSGNTLKVYSNMGAGVELAGEFGSPTWDNPDGGSNLTVARFGSKTSGAAGAGVVGQSYSSSGVVGYTASSDAYVGAIRANAPSGVGLKTSSGKWGAFFSTTASGTQGQILMAGATGMSSGTGLAGSVNIGYGNGNYLKVGYQSTVGTVLDTTHITISASAPTGGSDGDIWITT